MDLILIAAPWIIGANVGFLCGCHKNACNGYKSVYAGVGGVLGYFAIVGLVQISIWSTRNLLHPYLVWTLWVGVCISTCILCYCLARAYNSKKSIPLLLILFVLTATLLTNLMQVVQLPIFAWDALSGEWNHPGYAARAQHLSAQYGHASITGDGITHRHSISNFVLLSWSGWISHGSSIHSPSMPWLLMQMSCVLVVIGYGLIIMRSTILALLLGWMSATVPLLENHALIGSYHEILMSAIQVGSCALVAVGFYKSSMSHIFFGAIMALLLLATKSTGSAYLITVWFALICTIFLGYSKKAFIGFAGISLIGFVVLWHFGFDFKLGSQHISWMPEERTVIFAGRSQQLVNLDLGLLFRHYFHALHINSSFTLAPLFLIITLFLAKSPFTSHTLDQSRTFILLVMFFGIAIFSLSLATEYGLMHSGPGTDRQYTRSLLPIISTSFLFFPHAISVINTRKSIS
ncbi:MAG: hypothetical protein ABJ056_08670 [Halioglobus sp.]